MGGSDCINFDDYAVLEGFMEGMAKPSMPWEHILEAQLHCPEDFANALNLSDAMRPLGHATPAAAAAAAAAATGSTPGSRRRSFATMQQAHRLQHRDWQGLSLPAANAAADADCFQYDGAEDLNLDLDLDAELAEELAEELAARHAAKRANLPPRPTYPGLQPHDPLRAPKRHSSMYSPVLESSCGYSEVLLDGQAASYPAADECVQHDMQDARPIPLQCTEPILSDEAMEQTFGRTTTLQQHLGQQRLQQKLDQQQELCNQASLSQMQLRGGRQHSQQLPQGGLELSPHAGGEHGEFGASIDQKDGLFGLDDDLVCERWQGTIWDLG